MTVHMCEQCFPHGIEVGLIGPPNLWLIFNEGHYHLLWDNGHKGDIVVSFERPRIDPDPEDREDASGELLDACLLWIDEADDTLTPQLQMSPDHGESFMAACRKGGYGHVTTQHYMLNHWLYHRCALLIQTHEQTHGPIPNEAPESLSGGVLQSGSIPNH